MGVLPILPPSDPSPNRQHAPAKRLHKGRPRIYLQPHSLEDGIESLLLGHPVEFRLGWQWCAPLRQDVQPKAEEECEGP
jgi:hypothetical protein